MTHASTDRGIGAWRVVAQMRECSGLRVVRRRSERRLGCTTPITWMGDGGHVKR